MPEVAHHSLSPVALMLDASGVVLVVLLLLLVASTAVWGIWVAKALQLRRLRDGQRAFDQATETCLRGEDLLALVDAMGAQAPGSRVAAALASLLAVSPHASTELLHATAKREVLAEEQAASRLMPTLSSIASASPFIGLFGTVWGIMDAFFAIGAQGSASLPVVAPAIGEALIATAFGLLAAIPATIGYNFLDRRIGDFTENLSAASERWVALLVRAPEGARGHSTTGGFAGEEAPFR